MEATVANLEKHSKRPVEQIEEPVFSPVQTHARSPYVLGSYIKNRQDDVRGRRPDRNIRHRWLFYASKTSPPRLVISNASANVSGC
jgi:hypothetical protein